MIHDDTIDTIDTMPWFEPKLIPACASSKLSLGFLFIEKPNDVDDDDI